MRFENILHIYWTKGIFISGKLHYFDSSLSQVLNTTYGAGSSLKNLVSRRFEISEESYMHKRSLPKIEAHYNIFLTRPLNIVMSQLFSVNNSPVYLVRLRVISYFLNKTYRGKCHAVGKPVRGQRTWSNAWTSFKVNNLLRLFISNMKKKSQLDKSPDKINFRLTKKKYSPAKKASTVSKVTHKRVSWF